ncbi:ABC transporter permease [Natronorubrum sp. DTA28]|uniref:ABC transporter permease n=1 Tax=Natronorubrum sp. DTA28 TaxID=3447019 RepID=UPI003F82A945
MSPAVAAALSSLAIVGGDSTLVTAQSIGGVDLRRPLGVAVGWTVLTLVVGGILLAGFASPIRAIRDDALERPDLTFATGFLVFFSPLVVASIPLFVLTYVADHPAVLGAGALVSLPALIVAGGLLVVGGTIGSVVIGDRIAGSFGTEAPSLGRSLAVGSVVLGSSQLVPVVGTLVAIVFAAVGTGAFARRRFDPWNDDEERKRVRDGPARPDRPTVRSTERWEGGDSDGTAVWRSTEIEGNGTETEPETPSGVVGRVDDETEDSNRLARRRTDGARSSTADGKEQSTDEWTVDDWAWEIGADRGDETEGASKSDR